MLPKKNGANKLIGIDLGGIVSPMLKSLKNGWQAEWLRYFWDLVIFVHDLGKSPMTLAGSTLELTHNHGAEMDDNFKVPKFAVVQRFDIAAKMERMGLWSLCRMDWHGHIYAQIIIIYLYGMYILGPAKTL